MCLSVTNKHLKIDNGNIDFRDISFKYSESLKNVLHKINLEFRSGQMTALVGHSGAGKSTIINLLPRFYDPQEGSISIDGQKINIKDFLKFFF